MHNYWNNFYTNTDLTQCPSSFAKHVGAALYGRSVQSIMDFGCGNGRAIPFLHAVLPTTIIHAVDFSQEALNLIPSYTYIQKHKCRIPDELSSLLDVHNLDVAYSRFFLHSIPHTDQVLLLHFLCNYFNTLFIECRSCNDVNKDKYGEEIAHNVFNNAGHYRFLVNPDVVYTHLKRYDFIINMSESYDYSPMKNDVPLLLRIEGHRYGI